jgi:hypothetical protein
VNWLGDTATFAMGPSKPDSGEIRVSSVGPSFALKDRHPFEKEFQSIFHCRMLYKNTVQQDQQNDWNFLEDAKNTPRGTGVLGLLMFQRFRVGR